MYSMLWLLHQVLRVGLLVISGGSFHFVSYVYAFSVVTSPPKIAVILLVISGGYFH